MLKFKGDGTLPQDRSAVRRVRRASSWYCVLNRRLYRRGFVQPLLRCLRPTEAQTTLAELVYLGQSISPLPESYVSASPPILCPSRMPRPVHQSFARVVCLGQSISLLPESYDSAGLSVVYSNRVFRPVFHPNSVPRPAQSSLWPLVDPPDRKLTGSRQTDGARTEDD
ncbi:hypothetical protein GW17_00051762 [Ensete ventricosum]|nr:hypothetical protein GW17_00051762 [Ensete ventricosum]